LFALNSDQLQPEGQELLRSLAAPLAADTCDQRFGMRGLAIAEGLQVLAQVAHQCLLCLGLFTHHLGPAGLGCDAAALETVAQAGQLLLHYPQVPMLQQVQREWSELRSELQVRRSLRTEAPA
ncbi:hypothetical protein PWG68_19695, partial [Chromobacterium amazonense]